MKKILCLFLILAVCFCFSGCGLFKDGIFITQTSEANRLTDEIMECFKSFDKQRLKDLFSSNAKSTTTDFDTQIDEIFEYFDGDVISFKRTGGVAGSESVRKGKLTSSRITNSGSVKIVTSEDEYKMSFSAVLVNEKESNIGIWRIWLGKSDSDYLIIGNSDMPN